MKKTAKTAAMAAMFAVGTMVALTGCETPDANQQTVYGPPPVVEDMEEPLTRFETTTEPAETTTNELEVTTEFMQCVYGPPPTD